MNHTCNEKHQLYLYAIQRGFYYSYDNTSRYDLICFNMLESCLDPFTLLTIEEFAKRDFIKIDYARINSAIRRMYHNVAASKYMSVNIFNKMYIDFYVNSFYRFPPKTLKFITHHNRCVTARYRQRMKKFIHDYFYDMGLPLPLINIIYSYYKF